jgi:hypothetical protein
MAPKWFPVDSIPYESMWLDDSIWLKHFLAGKKFRGHFLFANDSEITQREKRFKRGIVGL